MFVSMHTEFFTLVFFLSLLIHNVRSLGVEITAPPGGSTWPAGPITVTWSDAGGSPSMADLSTYILELVVGGNNAGDSAVLVTIGKRGGLVADGSVSGQIPASSAQSIQNGFYLKMTSNTTDGNQVLNYSGRFTLINMNGTTESQYLEGANANAGDVTNVPEAQYNVLAPPPSATEPTSTTTLATSTTTSGSTTRQPTHAHHSADDGLSSVTIGLIVMGSILALIGVISVIVWILLFCRRIRRKRKEAKLSGQHNDEDGKPIYLGNKTELAAYRSSRAVPPAMTPVEMNAERETQEVSGVDKAIEAPGSPMVFELEGDLSAWEAGSGRRSQAWHPV